MSKANEHIELVDKSFDSKKTNTYKLYIEVSIECMKLTVLNPESKTFVCFEQFVFGELSNDYALLEPIKKGIKSSKLCKYNFKQVVVSFVNTRSTLIPNAIYKAEELAAYHQFNFSHREEDEFHSDKLINLNAHNVYSIPDYLINCFKNIENVSFSHGSSSFIEASLLAAKNEKALSAIWVNVMNSSFQLSVIKGQELAFFNSFEYKSAEDFIYFLLFALDQLGISNDEANVNLVGDITKDAVLYTLLHQYIKTLNFGQIGPTLKRSYIFEDTPDHFHYSLFNQYLCE